MKLTGQSKTPATRRDVVILSPILVLTTPLSQPSSLPADISKKEWLTEEVETPEQQYTKVIERLKRQVY